MNFLSEFPFNVAIFKKEDELDDDICRESDEIPLKCFLSGKLQKNIGK